MSDDNEGKSTRIGGNVGPGATVGDQASTQADYIAGHDIYVYNDPEALASLVRETTSVILGNIRDNQQGLKEPLADLAHHIRWVQQARNVLDVLKPIQSTLARFQETIEACSEKVVHENEIQLRRGSMRYEIVEPGRAFPEVETAWNGLKELYGAAVRRVGNLPGFEQLDELFRLFGELAGHLDRAIEHERPHRNGRTYIVQNSDVLFRLLTDFSDQLGEVSGEIDRQISGRLQVVFDVIDEVGKGL